jgi:hypothetical protein
LSWACITDFRLRKGTEKAQELTAASCIIITQCDARVCSVF